MQKHHSLVIYKHLFFSLRTWELSWRHPTGAVPASGCDLLCQEQPGVTALFRFMLSSPVITKTCDHKLV